MNAIKKMIRLIDRINENVFILISLLFVPMTLIAVFEVAMRYLFNAPTTWAWDVNSQLFALLVVFGTAHTLTLKGHVVMDIVVCRFPEKTRLIISLLVYAIFISCMTLLVWQTAIFAQRSIALGEHASTLLAPPVYPLKTGICLGSGLLLLQAVSVFVKNLLVLAGQGEEATQ